MFAHICASLTASATILLLGGGRSEIQTDIDSDFCRTAFGSVQFNSEHTLKVNCIEFGPEPMYCQFDFLPSPHFIFADCLGLGGSDELRKHL